MILVSLLYSVPAQLMLCPQHYDGKALHGCVQETVSRASKMDGYFTLISTSINCLMRSEELIRSFGLRNGACGAICLRRLTDLLSSRSFLSVLKVSFSTQYWR